MRGGGYLHAFAVSDYNMGATLGGKYRGNHFAQLHSHMVNATEQI